jgi:two-component system, OmpR family, phosphate regulon response regulator PhoB
MPQCRILVVEDEPAIAELISLNLHHAGLEVTCVTDAGQAQAVVNGVLPSLAVVDWILPGQSGVALVRQWRREPRTQALPIVMLTGRSKDADVVAGLDAGADDYLTKPFSPKLLFARINALLRRRAPETLNVRVVLGPLSLDPATRRASAQNHEVQLNPTEFKLLHFFMTYPHQVHTRKMLLDRVWGDHVFIEERTIDAHIKRLRVALSRFSCDAMVETVRGAGYRLALEAPAVCN